jgi:hypothetical protein
VPDNITQQELMSRYQNYQPPAAQSREGIRSVLPETSDYLPGIVSRSAGLIGSGLEAIQRSGDYLATNVASALPFTSFTREQAEQVSRPQFVGRAAEATKAYAEGINYAPGTKLGDLADNPLKVIPFIAERIITSTPDMAAAVFAAPAYITARTNEILNERLKNDEKEIKDATVSDVASSLVGAVIETKLEKFATERLFKGRKLTGKNAATRILKEMGVQSGTEGLEEAAANIAGSLGTKRGVDPRELGENVLEGMIVGAGLGGGVRGTQEYLQSRKKPEEDFTEPKTVIDPETGIKRVYSYTPIDDPSLELGGTPEINGRKTYIYREKPLETEQETTELAPPVAPPSQEGVPSDVGVDQAAMETEVLRSQGQLPLAAPVAQPAQAAQTEDVQVAPPGEPVSAPPAAPVAQVAQTSTEDIVQLNDRGELKAPEVIDPNIEAQLAAEPFDADLAIPLDAQGNPIPPETQARKVRQPKQVTPPRVLLGTDADGNLNVPLDDGGIPFKTRQEAQAAKKLQPSLTVIPRKDGFVLAEKTEKQIAADNIKAERLKAGPQGILSAHEFIASLGGLNKKEASEIDKDAAKSNIRVGNRYLYSNKGMSIAEATEKLQEAGYIDSDSSNAGYQVIADSLVDPVYSINDADAIAERKFAERAEEDAAEFAKKEKSAEQEAVDVGRENAEFQDYLALERELADPESTMLEAGYTPAELQEAGFMDASIDLQTEVAALQDLATPENIDALNIIDALEPKTAQTVEEKVNAEEQAIATEIAQTAQPGGRADVGKADETKGAETKEPVKTSALTAAKPPADVTEVLVSPPTKATTAVAQPPVSPKWKSLPDMTWKDTRAIQLFDKHRNLDLVQKEITKIVGDISNELNAYRAETLAHGRAEREWKDFMSKEFRPIINEMKANNVTDENLTEYLVMRHAKEANDLIAKRNPNDPNKQDKGSGVSYKQREDYFKALDPAKKKVFESLSKKVDVVLAKTRDLLEEGGVITKEQRDAWESLFKFYVPLRREESDYSLPSSSYRRVGDYAKSRTGSAKDVIDVLSNVAAAREIAIYRIEKERVNRAVYGLSVMNPNPEFWMAISPDAIKNKDVLIAELENKFDLSKQDAEAFVKNIMAEPTKERFNKETGVVDRTIDTTAKYADYVLPVKIDGKDRFVFFNPKNDRAMQMVQSLRGLDVPQLGSVMQTIAPITRFFSAINTQYNLIFGAWNFARDIQGARINLSTTPIADEKNAVLSGTFSAIPDIYTAIREQNADQPFSDTSDGSWDDFTRHGGKVGYKDQFAKLNQSTNIVNRELAALDRGITMRGAYAVLNWVSNVNDVLENSTRLSAYRVAFNKFKKEAEAKNPGGQITQKQIEDMKARAAEIAKNITVNFNRKGTWGVTAGSLYAFFNASAQGTKRLYETLTGPKGKTIMAAGIGIGIAQAIALAMAGFDEDEPTEFMKQKNLIIPTGDGKYVMWPMPFGFNVFPNLGRIFFETASKTSKGQDITPQLVNTVTMLANAFNPLGGGGLLQMVTPTVADPIVALIENRDAFGRPISRESRATSPVPGYKLSRDPSPSISQFLAEFINTITFGDKDKKGLLSPTADQIEYLGKQLGGGVYREASGILTYVSDKIQDKETPDYKIPIAGKIVGDLNSPPAISQRFYSNVIKMAEHEASIKGRVERRESVADYMRKNPEAAMWRRANTLENEISKLNRRRRELVEKQEPVERIKQIDDQKTRMMKQFNDQVRKYDK